MRKLFWLAVLSLLVPVLAHAAPYPTVVTAPLDYNTKSLHADYKWTCTGGLDSLGFGFAANLVYVRLPTGSVATFDARMVPVGAGNLLTQQVGAGGTPTAGERANILRYGASTNETNFHTYTATDPLYMYATGHIYKGVIVQATAGTVLDIFVDKLDAVAPIR